MKLQDAIKNVNCELFGSFDTNVKGITYDSRKVGKDYIFVAMPGKKSNGKDFIVSAIANGASVIVTDKLIKTKPIRTIITSKDLLETLAGISANIYGRPDKNLLMIGITGTNGKTTVTYFIESIFKAASKPCGVIGTVNYRYAGRIIPAENTTPQSSDIFSMLAEMKKKLKTCIMEVSSHALSLNRVSGIEFDIAVFTNLTRDHLDFHKDMNGYFNAKSKLFTSLGPVRKKIPKFAIINIDDPYGRKLVKLAKNARIYTYSIKSKADFKAKNIKLNPNFTSFVVAYPGGQSKIRFGNLGLHNVYNALASFAVAFAAGINTDKIVSGLVQSPHAPGRLQKIDMGQNFSLVVDFAHTDDALKNVLSALKALKPKRMITLFGCGGDRDRTKRPVMGEIAARLSDFVILTSDNPRTEDPEKILLDIEVGIRRSGKENYVVIPDREQAIAQAVIMARSGDIILLAGKGHETYQIIGNQKIHFNDEEIARKYIEAKINSGAAKVKTA